MFNDRRLLHRKFAAPEQLLKVFCECEKRELTGSRSLLYSRRDRGRQRLPPAAQISIGNPPSQLQQMGIDERLAVYHAGDLFQTPVAGFAALCQPDAKRQFLSIAFTKGHLNPFARRDEFAQRLWHDIRKSLLERPGEGDLRDEPILLGRNLPLRTLRFRGEQFFLLRRFHEADTRSGQRADRAKSSLVGGCFTFAAPSQDPNQVNADRPSSGSRRRPRSTAVRHRAS